MMVILSGWYGHRTAAAGFHAHLSATLRRMGFRPSRTDMDLVWYREQGGTYEYLASYVDDVIVISADPMSVIEDLKESYVLKGVGVPEYYLGGNFDQITDPTFVNRKITNALSASTYINTCLEKFKRNPENLEMPPIIE
jgi:hypothetical protein